MMREVDFGFVRVSVDYGTGRVQAIVTAFDPTKASPMLATWGTSEITAGYLRPPPVPLGDRIAASIALTTALASRRWGLRGVVRLVEHASRLAARPATPVQAERAIAAVRRAADRRLTRVACLEESAAVVVLLAMNRRTVAWHHGVAPDPIRLHAWIEVDGQPIAEPDSTKQFATLLQINAERLLAEKDGHHD